MDWINFLLTTGLICSVFFYSRTILGWFKTESSPIKEDNVNFNVTVLIAFRNEEKKLNTLLHSLKSQNYPTALIAIILVDDHSSDQSLKIINDFIAKQKVHNITVLKNQGSGKKDALKTGLEKAGTTWVLCTDADCSFNENWILSMLKHCDNNRLIAGPVAFTGQNHIQTLSITEMNLVQLFTAAGFYRKKPYLCNAANLLFLKDDYLEFLNSGKYSKNASGDDVFFLHYLKEKHPQQIHFAKNTEAIVYTPAEPDLWSMISQKTRWASKTRNYIDKSMLFEGSLFFFVHLCYFIAIFHLIFSQNFSILALITMLTKLTGDIFLIRIAGNWFKRKTSLAEMIAFELFFPVYTLVVFILALQGSYSWKGRNYSLS